MKKGMKEGKIYGGLDVHKDFTYAILIDEKGKGVGEGKFPTNKEGFETFFKDFKKQDLKVVFEASRAWDYVAKLLSNQNINFIMAHPSQVKAIASAKIKTDKIDSKILAHLLRTDMVPESYTPPFELVDVRDIVRHRARLGKDSGRIKTLIRTVLAKEGLKLPYSTVDGVKAKEWIRKAEVSESRRLELNSYSAQLNLLNMRIKLLNTKIKEEILKRPEALLITTIPGFADYAALLIFCEIGDISRFPNPAALASYAGLAVTLHQSSNKTRTGGITKRGNTYLRWILIQCTNVTVRRDNKLKRFYLRLKEKKGHQKAIVATARKTLTIIWHMLQKQQVFQA